MINIKKNKKLIYDLNKSGTENALKKAESLSKDISYIKMALDKINKD